LRAISAEFIALSEQVSNTKIKIAAIEGTEKLVQDIDSVKSNVIDLSAEITAAVQELAAQVAVGIGEMIGNLISNVGNGFGSVFTFLNGLLAKFLKGLGEAMIQAGLAGLALKAAFTNPFATIAAGVALVAFSTAIQNAMSSTQAFANGGIVGGSSFYGDRILARVNSGELILNNKQQRSLYGMMNDTSGAVNVVLGGGFEIEGSKLRLVLDRTDKKNNRLG
jgi:hypothetical protein